MFKDAKDDESELSVNEWELQLRIQKANIDLSCTVQDLRFVFAVPTAKKLVNVGVKTLEIVEATQKEKLKERKIKLEMYEYVLARLSTIFESEE